MDKGKLNLAAAFCVVVTGIFGASACMAQDAGANAIMEAGDIHGKAMRMGSAIASTKLKGLYLRCSQESSQRMLAVDESAFCLGLADALKEKEFGGDFEALLVWWREHRDDDLSAYGVSFESSSEPSVPSESEED